MLKESLCLCGLCGPFWADFSQSAAALAQAGWEPMRRYEACKEIILLSDASAQAQAPVQEAVAALGWQLVCAPLAHGLGWVAAKRKPPLLLIVDGRETAAKEALEAVAAGQEAYGPGLALLLLVNDGQEALLDAAEAAGATHILTHAFTAPQLQRQLRMIARLGPAPVAPPAPAQAALRDLLGDQSTGLQQKLTRLLAHQSGFDPAAVLLLISISHFDRYDAELGTAKANQLLALAGERIAQHVAYERGAFFARRAGAEFATILSAPISIHQALHVAERIAQSFADPFMLEEQRIFLVCRVGVAPAAAQARDIDPLFQQARLALDAARRQGPNSVQLFLSPQQGQPPISFASLEEDLRTALDNNGLEIVFQPQVDIARRQICGVEALVRWEHAHIGAIAPEMILALAARAEFAERLGRYIIEKVLWHARQWPLALNHLRISINVTASDLQAADFEEFLLAAIAKTGISPRRITLELTEGVMIENIAQAVGIFERLRRAGLGIAIDDFGTGYSALAYLTALPLDYLKIDKKLITDVAASARERVVVRGIVDMARSLGLCVVAEGVENEAQLEQLAREGVNWYQGYLCTPPLESHVLADFVALWLRNGRDSRGAA